jgi:hypothetical protein
MGLRVEREHFDADDYRQFSERLARSLDAMRGLLDRPGFGVGPRSLGAELELFLIDGAGRPLPLNREVLADSLDDRLTVELDRFNLECNLRPTALAGRPFAHLEREMHEAVEEVRRAAQAHDGDVAVIGILPTLREADLQRGAMTDEPRYRALSAALRQVRHGPFQMHIDGREPLDVHCDDVTFEGANTSLQLHLRVDPADFAPVFNAVQLATAPAVALAGNSPTGLGHRLWQETRVALFKQAVDDREAHAMRESRVAFGSGWVGESALELFQRNVVRHDLLLPIVGEEDPLETVQSGGVPQLDELRLHQGTIWHWNRVVYDSGGGGHLRIEMRGLPAGPTALDMAANSAFLIGLALGIARDAEAWCEGLAFAVAEHNFYRAAQDGLAAELIFPSEPGAAAQPMRASELIERLEPVARDGLLDAGVEPAECERYLGVALRRAASGRTGAHWQSCAIEALEPRLGRPHALAEMLGAYLARAGSGRSVDEWTLEERDGDVPVRMAPGKDEVPERIEDFLRGLGGPAVLRLPGRDRSRTRVVTTLLHGNEPSGVRAVHGLLRAGFEPAVDALFVIGSIEAALAAPGFAFRRLPDAQDLNRCFREPFAGSEGALAREVLEVLRAARPEALVDLHNNTGRSVPYGVGPAAGPAELGLVALFASRYVHSDLRLGALVEATAEEFPSVVIECGRAGDPAADGVAGVGLERFLGAVRIGEVASPGVRVVTDPVRVEAVPGIRLAVGDGPQSEADLTVAADMDQYNFGTLRAGHTIGWVRPGSSWPLRALRGDGSDVAHSFFSIENGEVRTRREAIAIMITNDPGCAVEDCLFYVVRDAGPQTVSPGKGASLPE